MFSGQIAGIFIVRDTLRVARGCFGGRKVKDLWCMPCVACEGVKVLYRGVQNCLTCAGELQGESMLLKLAFKDMFGAAAGVIYPQTTPRFPLGRSQLEQDKTRSKLDMKQYAQSETHLMPYPTVLVIWFKMKKGFFFSFFFFFSVSVGNGKTIFHLLEVFTEQENYFHV